MNYLLNFAHPLTSCQREDLVAALGEFDEIHQPAQFDLSAPTLRHQVARLVEVTIDENELRGQAIVAVIPPSLSAAAYWVGLELGRHGYRNVPGVWMKRAGDGVPMTFLIGGVE